MVRAWDRNWLCWFGDCLLSWKSFGGDLYWTRRTFEATESRAVSQSCFWYFRYLKFWRQDTAQDPPVRSSAEQELARLGKLYLAPASALSVECPVRLGCFRNTYLDWHPGGKQASEGQGAFLGCSKTTSIAGTCFLDFLPWWLWLGHVFLVSGMALWKQPSVFFSWMWLTPFLLP